MLTCLLAFVGFGVYTAWRGIDVINPDTWKCYTLYLPFFFLLIILIAATPVITGKATFMSPLVLIAFILVTVAAFISAVFLRRTRLASIDISLRALISALNKDKHINAKLLSARPTQKLDAPLGITLSTIGIAIIIIPALLFGLLQDFSNPHISTPAALANQLLTPFGLFLLLRARRYRQVNADSLLAVDNRKPILFLRSFADDERQKSPWNPNTKRAIFDFSLEIRLAKHFMYFGPFIAVASPTEALPLGGAARVKVSDSEWQARVITWIRDSSLIIMYCGKTNWVKWELGKVLEEGRMHNLILIMPETRGFTRRRRQQDAAARVESIRDVLGDTAWADTSHLLATFLAY